MAPFLFNFHKTNHYRLSRPWWKKDEVKSRQRFFTFLLECTLMHFAASPSREENEEKLKENAFCPSVWALSSVTKRTQLSVRSNLLFQPCEVGRYLVEFNILFPSSGNFFSRNLCWRWRSLERYLPCGVIEISPIYSGKRKHFWIPERKLFRKKLHPIESTVITRPRNIFHGKRFFLGGNMALQVIKLLSRKIELYALYYSNFHMWIQYWTVIKLFI